MPLVSVVPVLQPLLLAFACVFSKPQRRHFDHYIQSLIVQDHRRTLTQMSRQVVEGPDASAWDRFVTVAPWDLPTLNRTWRRFLRRQVRRLRPPGRRIAGRQTDFLIFDDTHQRRSGAALEGAGYHFVHSQSRTSWGHSLVLAAYRTGDFTFACGADVYVRQVDVERLNREREPANLRRNWDDPLRRPPWAFHSKIDHVLTQLASFQPPFPERGVFVLFDSWYLNQEIVRAARSRGFDWCSTLKRNRALTLVDLSLETGEVRAEWGLSVGEWLDQLAQAGPEPGRLPFAKAALGSGWETVTVGGRTYRVLAYRGRLNGIGLVQIVVAQERLRDGRWSACVPLVTNRLDLSVVEVLVVHQERWQVEVLIRDLKQNLGLTDCMLERLEGTVRHWLLALVSQALLMLLRLRAAAGEVRTANGQPVASVGRTLGEVRQFVKQCALAELIRWTCAQAAQGRTATEIALGLGLPG
jgi:DDE superfamily endonuclease